MVVKLGCIRVTNKRKNIGPKPVPGEIVLDGDRGMHNIFRNDHVLYDHSDNEGRARVIALHKIDFDNDWNSHGPMYHEVHRLANLIMGGKKIALRCWCKPKPCHLDHVVDKINEVVNTQLSDSLF